jgi:hypothetical protein
MEVSLSGHFLPTVEIRKAYDFRLLIPQLNLTSKNWIMQFQTYNAIRF